MRKHRIKTIAKKVLAKDKKQPLVFEYVEVECSTPGVVTWDVRVKTDPRELNQDKV